MALSPGIPTQGARQLAALGATGAGDFRRLRQQATFARLQRILDRRHEILGAIARIREERQARKARERGEQGGPAFGGAGAPVGAGVGAAIGSIIAPGPGTLVGAQIGSQVGGGVESAASGDVSGATGLLGNAFQFVPNPIGGSTPPGTEFWEPGFEALPPTTTY